jgi:site-specific recombinase XerD
LPARKLIFHGVWNFKRRPPKSFEPAVSSMATNAGLESVPASPKGLRHGFGVAAVIADIPLNLVQKWLGHAQLSTTAVYANAVGAEEKDIARRVWG